MSNRLIAWMMVFALGSFVLGATGCGEEQQPEQPEKTMEEKLGSDNADEQMEGLSEADQKFGGAP